MSNYEKIKKIVESGCLTLVTLDNGKYIIYSSMRGDNINASDTCCTIEECYDTLGFSFEIISEINEQKIDKIEAINVNDIV